jgi:hypothetical protein
VRTNRVTLVMPGRFRMCLQWMRLQ